MKRYFLFHKDAIRHLKVIPAMPAWKPLESVFHGMCLAATVVMVSWCAYEYSKDDDFCEIAFKDLNEDDQAVYPSVSVCLGNPFLENEIKLQAPNFTSEDYENVLKGSQFGMAKPWPLELLSLDYENVTKQISKHWVSTTLLTDNGPLLVKNITSLVISGGLFHVKCFSFNMPFYADTTFGRVDIMIRQSFFNSGARPTPLFGFSTFFHYPHQLTRALQTVKLDWPRSKQNSFKMKFKIKGIEIFKRRNKYKKPCYDGNYDESFADDIMKTCMCKPPYWQTNVDLPACSNMT